MRKVGIICLVIALSTLITTGTVKGIQILGADVAKVGELEAGSLTVGEQGVGGVTFFNGTIINETTNGGLNNPVTFGDNVRIDGKVWRGSQPGLDGKPFSINDDVEIAGKLIVAGQQITAAADYTSRFNSVDSNLTTLLDNLAVANSGISTVNTNVGTVNTNVGVVNDSVGNTISTIVNAHNNQVDILNNIAYHGVINCINTQYLSGGGLEYCESPTYITRLVQPNGFGPNEVPVLGAPDGKIQEYQDKVDQLRKFIEEKQID